MPLTAKGKETLKDFRKRYGSKKGEAVFYATINKGKLKGMEAKRPRKKTVRKKK
jgi:hypothetical protein|tara:strand:+ start:7852 stop:8013 length:162 start_codon:yes stop_codon:yes gene_type:complete